MRQQHARGYMVIRAIYWLGGLFLAALPITLTTTNYFTELATDRIIMNYTRHYREVIILVVALLGSALFDMIEIYRLNRRDIYGASAIFTAIGGLVVVVLIIVFTTHFTGYTLLGSEKNETLASTKLSIIVEAQLRPMHWGFIVGAILFAFVTKCAVSWFEFTHFRERYAAQQ